MADEKPKDGEPNKTDEAKGSVSLTEASKSGKIFYQKIFEFNFVMLFLLFVKFYF